MKVGVPGSKGPNFAGYIACSLKSEVTRLSSLILRRQYNRVKAVGELKRAPENLNVLVDRSLVGAWFPNIPTKCQVAVN